MKAVRGRSRRLGWRLPAGVGPRDNVPQQPSVRRLSIALAAHGATLVVIVIATIAVARQHEGWPSLLLAGLVLGPYALFKAVRVVLTAIGLRMRLTQRASERDEVAGEAPTPDQQR